MAKTKTICGTITSNGAVIGGTSLFTPWSSVLADKRMKNTNFSGAFTVVEKDEVKSVYIKRVLYNKPVVVVWWSDGTQTKTKVRGADNYSVETGLLYCVLKKIVPTVSLNELCADWTPEQLTMDMHGLYVDIKDVRAKHKAK